MNFHLLSVCGSVEQSGPVSLSLLMSTPSRWDADERDKRGWDHVKRGSFYAFWPALAHGDFLGKL